MQNLTIPYTYQGAKHQLELVFVAGTLVNDPFQFGNEHAVDITDFYLATTQTTQTLWKMILGEQAGRSQYPNGENPVEYVSWYECQDFIERLNEWYGGGGIFRLPTETEWEYAACGGRHWREGFQFAGTNNMDEAGWYEGNAGPYSDPAEISLMKNSEKLTKPHPVGSKKANQLGIYDMNGNLWEWCHDWFTSDTCLVPKDGSAYCEVTNDKVLRGGCHHNSAIHCTNTKRYAIGPQSFDGCIGFRLALNL